MRLTNFLEKVAIFVIIGCLVTSMIHFMGVTWSQIVMLLAGSQPR